MQPKLLWRLKPFLLILIVFISTSCNKSFDFAKVPPNQNVAVESVFPPEIAHYPVQIKAFKLDQYPDAEAFEGDYNRKASIVAIRTSDSKAALDVATYYQSTIKESDILDSREDQTFWIHFNDGTNRGILWTINHWFFKIASPSELYFFESIDKFEYIQYR